MEKETEIVNRMQRTMETAVGSMQTLINCFTQLSNDLNAMDEKRNFDKQLYSLACGYYKKKLTQQEIELEKVKENIILSTENANRKGRPTLTDDEICRIKELLQSGASYRDIAKQVGCSVGTVHNYGSQE